MKKSLLYVSALFLALCSCAKELDDYEPADGYFEVYLEDFGITIPYQNVSHLKTYNLLEELIDCIDKNQIYLITFPSNDLFYPSVSVFNEYLWNNEEAAALFSRTDCVPVLISVYVADLNSERSFDSNIRFDILELILASDIFMSRMNVTEKVQLTALALTRAKYEEYSHPYPFNIMISIMLSSDYAPFVENVKPMLRESTMGVHYWLDANDDRGIVPGADLQATDLITGYAKQYLNDNK